MIWRCLHDFNQKLVFFKKRFWFRVWSRKSLLGGFMHFVAVFDVFNLVLIFMLFDHFGRLLASFERLNAF